MERQDRDLAWMLQYENIAWYEDGTVKILDRRIYPIETKFVLCKTHGEVAKAITDMVTQSAGPYVAAAMGMALAGYECRGQSEQSQIAHLQEAADTISSARPTTQKRMVNIVSGCVDAAKQALAGGEKDVSIAIRDYAIEINDRRYYRIGEVAKYLVQKFPTHGAIMTQCFAETIVGQMLKEARKNGKDIKIFCPETRPYFQGARLTAKCIEDMGFDVTVISDGMVASAIKNRKVDVFTTAADAICCDGSVINKVGTFNTAIVADYFGVSYYVTGTPDPGHPTADTVEIEMRDGERILYAMNERITAEGINGYYPAFDVTPPELVTGVVTDLGIYRPYDLNRYFTDQGANKGGMSI